MTANVLRWEPGDITQHDPSAVESAYGDGQIRLYRLFEQASGRWMVTFAAKGSSGALVRGWALSPDEAKSIAESWETLFRRHEMPPPVDPATP
ncbi:hypothetical protein [Mycolicibacterium peregrinum]|uniref:hypothetical protein n=1 Tax=Mycolicibacterium peregrinum TaxID=43304 RepID=UPI0010427931|nr:hypothetical protein [Mycolicibacterium peregrinum]